MDTQKKVSLFEDDDDDDIRVEREREGRRLTTSKGALRFGPTTLCERKRRRRSPLERVLQQRISLGVVFLECDSSRKR